MSIKNTCFLDVYVWDTVYLRGEAGHVSVAVRRLNKFEKLIKRRYFGFWPHREFSALDVPFHFPAVEKLTLDEEVWYEENDPLFIPNKHYAIAINEEQFTKVEREINDQSTNIRSGKTRYTWLSSINHIFYNTFDWRTYFQKKEPINLENCSTIAVKIMNAGGVPIKRNNLLWGISPVAVSHQLDHLITQNKITAIRSAF